MDTKTEVPEWKVKLRKTGRICYIAAFFLGILISVSQYGVHAAAIGSGVAYGLMLALAVILVFGLITFFRGRAEK